MFSLSTHVSSFKAIANWIRKKVDNRSNKIDDRYWNRIRERGNNHCHISAVHALPSSFYFFFSKTGSLSVTAPVFLELIFFLNHAGPELKEIRLTLPSQCLNYRHLPPALSCRISIFIFSSNHAYRVIFRKNKYPTFKDRTTGNIKALFKTEIDSDSINSKSDDKNIMYKSQYIRIDHRN